MNDNYLNKESEFAVITKSRKLCDYVMQVTQRSPKQFRFTYVSRMQNLALGALEAIIRANDIPVEGKACEGNLQKRYDYQGQAITGIKLLAYFAEMALEQGCITGKQYEQIALFTTDCRRLLGAWINSDKRRFSSEKV